MIDPSAPSATPPNGMTASAANAASGTIPRLGKGQALAAWATGVYLIALAYIALWLLFDIWGEHFRALTALFGQLPPSPTAKATVKLVSYTMLGAMIGGVLLSFHGLHRYVAIKGQFSLRYMGSYLLGPIAASLLGLAAFALVRGGLMTFGASEPPASGGATSFAYFALGILTGFAWQRVINKIDDLARQLFSSTRENAGPEKSSAGQETGTKPPESKAPAQDSIPPA